MTVNTISKNKAATESGKLKFSIIVTWLVRRENDAAIRVSNFDQNFLWVHT